MNRISDELNGFRTVFITKPQPHTDEGCEGFLYQYIVLKKESEYVIIQRDLNPDLTAINATPCFHKTQFNEVFDIIFKDADPVGFAMFTDEADEQVHRIVVSAVMSNYNSDDLDNFLYKLSNEKTCEEAYDTQVRELAFDYMGECYDRIKKG